MYVCSVEDCAAAAAAAAAAASPNSASAAAAAAAACRGSSSAASSAASVTFYHIINCSALPAFNLHDLPDLPADLPAPSSMVCLDST